MSGDKSGEVFVYCNLCACNWAGIGKHANVKGHRTHFMPCTFCGGFVKRAEPATVQQKYATFLLAISLNAE